MSDCSLSHLSIHKFEALIITYSKLLWYQPLCCVNKPYLSTNISNKNTLSSLPSSRLPISTFIPNLSGNCHDGALKESMRSPNFVYNSFIVVWSPLTSLWRLACIMILLPGIVGVLDLVQQCRCRWPRPMFLHCSCTYQNCTFTVYI